MGLVTLYTKLLGALWLDNKDTSSWIKIVLVCLP